MYKVMYLHCDGCGFFEDRSKPFRLGSYPARTWESKNDAIAFAEEQQRETDAAGLHERYHVYDRGRIIHKTTPNPASIYLIHYYTDDWHVLRGDDGKTACFTSLDEAIAAGHEQGEYTVYRTHDYKTMASSAFDRSQAIIRQGG